MHYERIYMTKGFLPMSRKDMERLGIKQLDFVYVIGDAYVDHPSFGSAIISRVLDAHGYSVGIISQPDWKDPESVKALGTPRLGFLVSGGNMDSMVNHYTVSKKHRQKDSYTPGGVMGKRPDRAAMVYCNLIRSVYKDSPIIVGGIEASLRRMAHYDYWDDKLRRSLLMDSGADLISYGMGERSIVEIADALASGIAVQDITFIDGTCYKTKSQDTLYDCTFLPDWDSLQADKKNYAKSFYEQYCNTDPFVGKRLVEQYGSVYVVQNKPSKPLTMQEMDDIYALPYMRTYPKEYDKLGGIPAISEVKFSLISNRGCFGGCNFCALTFHQGRIVQVRSHDSILDEANVMTKDPQFKGYIHDVGGPTADFRQPSCQKQLVRGVCKTRQCLFPKPCPNLEVSHKDYIELLRKLRALPKVKKVFIRSGIRFDYMVADKSDAFLEELCRYHVSGQLKVAPEHVSNNVLRTLGKPDHEIYQEFVRRYENMNRRTGMDQYVVPYFMSSHPGCTMKDAVKLAEYLRDIHHEPEQMQDFYPTPSTVSTCMYYTGVDPRNMQEVYIPKNPHEKAMQRALMQYRRPENYELVEEALKLAHREDLIGWGEKCLLRPRRDDGSIPVFGKKNGEKKDGAKGGNGKNGGKFGKSSNGKASAGGRNGAGKQKGGFGMKKSRHSEDAGTFAGSKSRGANGASGRGTRGGAANANARRNDRDPRQTKRR